MLNLMAVELQDIVALPHSLVSAILGVTWAALAIYWLISAVGVKRDVRKSGSYAQSVILRLIFIIVLVWLFNQPSFVPTMKRIAAYTDHPGLALQIVGVVLTVGGAAFAMWARVYLGRNWSAVPALKEGHELVTGGPYHIVRNPIYTGILFGLLGSALAAGLIFWIIFIVCAVAFVARVFAEDKLMKQQFPDTYPAYRRKTKALIPYVV